MIGIIGVGGGGGNVANTASKYFKTAAINFSQRDLNALDNVKKKLRIIGSEGVGKNRDLAIELFSKHYETTLEFIENEFSSSKIIIVAFSTGGGSGSGISPMILDLLSRASSDKVFVAMPIIPDMSESITNQVNTLQVFEELFSLDIAVLPIDNEKAKISGLNGKHEIYSYTNTKSIELIRSIYDYTQMESKNGNFDEKDLTTVLSTKGLCVISEASIPQSYNQALNLSGDAIPKIIHNSWIDSPFMEIEYEKVVRAGFVFNGNEDYIKEINLAAIFNKFKYGMPIDLFESYYGASDGKFTTIISGLSFPLKRISKIEEIISSNESKIEAVLDNSFEYKSKSILALKSLKQKNTVDNNASSTVDSIFAKYKR